MLVQAVPQDTGYRFGKEPVIGFVARAVGTRRCPTAFSLFFLRGVLFEHPKGVLRHLKEFLGTRKKFWDDNMYF